MQIKTQGLIIKEQTIGESDRLVTVLTRDNGVLRAFARRAKNLKDSKSAATQLLCYSRLSVFKGRDKYIIDDAEPIEVFSGFDGTSARFRSRSISASSPICWCPRRRTPRSTCGSC